MANIKKGELANIIFPMVDDTDFASIESGITESDFNSAATRQYVGYDHGASATAAFSDLSKTTNLVRSGIFHHVLNETETNFDIIMVRFTHPSCADQLMVYHTVTYDDSDTYSQLSDIGSNLLSYMTGMSGAISDVESQVDLVATSAYLSDVQSNLLSYLTGMSGAISDVDSQVLLNASMISDTQSQVDLLATSAYLSDVQSNLLSYLTGMSGAISDVDSQLLLTASLVSDIDSQLLLNASMISDTQSQVDLVATSDYLSQVHSDLYSAIGAVTASVDASDMSDIASRVWATTEGTRVDSRILVIQSNLSDVESQVDLLATSDYLSQVHSDLRSQVSGITASIDASDMSDIASRVWATTEGTRVDSRILVIQSMVSDVDSQVLLNASMISDVDSQVNLLATSDYLSQVHSDLYSAIGGVTASIDASDMSDIASRVWATTEGTRVDSRILVIQSMVSDVDSQVNLLASSDYLSQVHSDLRSQVSGITASIDASDMSDIASRVWATTEGTRVDSRILVIQSNLSDVESQVDLVATSAYLSDVHSDLLSYLAGISGAVSDVDSQLLLNASMISDTQSAADSQFAYLSEVISDAHSDLGSQIGGVTASIDASDISDVASAVWADPIGTRVDSRILVLQSNLSDVESQVDLVATSDYLSQVHSDLYSAIGNVSVTLTASDISDIASAVSAEIGSDVSDIYSLLSDVESQIDAGVTISYSAGAIEYTYTVTDSGTGNPIDGVEVWVTTDLAGTNVVWAGTTDALGVARDAGGGLPWLDAGTYYFWKQIGGYVDDDNPDTEVVS